MRDMGNGIVFVLKISFVSGVTGAEAFRKSFTGLRRSLPSPFQQRDCYEGRNGDERRLTETARTMRKSCILSRRNTNQGVSFSCESCGEKPKRRSESKYSTKNRVPSLDGGH